MWRKETQAYPDAPDAATTERVTEKHQRISEAVERIDSIIYQATSLLDQINHNEEKSIEPSAKTTPYPSLLKVLDETPLTIDSKCDELARLLSDIRASLF